MPGFAAWFMPVAQARVLVLTPQTAIHPAKYKPLHLHLAAAAPAPSPRSLHASTPGPAPLQFAAGAAPGARRVRHFPPCRTHVPGQHGHGRRGWETRRRSAWFEGRAVFGQRQVRAGRLFTEAQISARTHACNQLHTAALYQIRNILKAPTVACLPNATHGGRSGQYRSSS